MIRKLWQFCREYGVWYTMRKVIARALIKYRLGRKYCPITIPQAQRKAQEAWRPSHPVMISIVVPLYHTPELYLREMIESVIGQTYACWELCLVDASEDPEKRQRLREVVAEYQKREKRIRFLPLSSNAGIAENTNQGLACCTGQYIGLLDHDDLLHPSALYEVMQEIETHHAELVYTDELSFVKTPERVQSIHFKPDFSQENLRCNNYICHFIVFSRSLLEKTGGLRKEFDGSQDYDLLLRLTDEADRIAHVPRVLYYWRVHADSVSASVAAKPYTVEAGRKALEEHLKRRGISGSVEAALGYGAFYRIRYEVPSSMRILLMAETEAVAEWLLQDTRSLPYPMEIHAVTAPRFDVDEQQFDVIVLVRDGFRPKESGSWLTELLACLVPEQNMAAAPVVYDRRGRVLHAGYSYCPQRPDRVYGQYQGVPGKDPSYMYRLAFRQNVSLLGGAVLAVKKEVYMDWVEENLEVGPRKWNGWGAFSPQTWFSLCLKANSRWGDCIYTPYAPFVQTAKPSAQARGQTEAAGDAWQQFDAMWDRVWKREDPHTNPWMDVFGRYYLCGKERRMKKQK